jgi:glycine cleavage system H protein
MNRVPEGLFYTKQHEWAKRDGDRLFVGITDFAQHSLGDIVFIDLPQKGVICKAGESFGTIESVKAAEDIYSPASGTVVDTNGALAEHPESVNRDPYEFWLIELKDVDMGALSSLMNAEAYSAYLSTLDH